jgi:hypothetical protein
LASRSVRLRKGMFDCGWRVFREGTCNERGVLGDRRRGEGNGTRRGKRLTVYKEVGSELLSDCWVTLGVRGPAMGLPQM